MVDLLDRFFPLDMRDTMVLELIKLCQENISLKVFAMKFTQLSRYDPAIVVDPRARMSKFYLEVSKMVVKE